MIGVRYWSTGITLTPAGPDFAPGSEWSLSLDFFDNGFCEADASEGTLRMRYVVAYGDLPLAAATLKQDAERLGIEWAENVPACPGVYVAQDGEGICHGVDDWQRGREIANEVARSLGWTPTYAEEVSA